MEVTFFEGRYIECMNITWDDVVDKLSYEFNNQTQKVVFQDQTKSPTIVCHSDYYPNTIQKAFDEVNSIGKVKDLHVYVSFAENSSTFDRHCDQDDVLIVQAIGKVSYYFDDDQYCTLCPGDGLYIPKGIYHRPVVHESRVSLSFGI